MKKYFLLFVLLLATCLPAWGQSSFSRIDSFARSAPDTFSTYTSLANYLAQFTQTDIEKARILFIWVAENLVYNTEKLLLPLPKPVGEVPLNALVQQKLGVCEDYANLFEAMGKSIGLEVFTITGYTQLPHTPNPDVGHAWNAVKLEGAYFLFDPTWAGTRATSGQLRKKADLQYFMVKPGAFIRTHMPIDPIWQFLGEPITYQEYNQRPNYSPFPAADSIPYRDSIQAFLSLAEEGRFLQTVARVQNTPGEHPFLDIIRGHQADRLDHITYTRIVDSFNLAVRDFNDYLAHRTRLFKNPNPTDSMLRNRMTSIDQQLTFCESVLETFSPKAPSIKIHLREWSPRFASLRHQFTYEQTFVQRYLKTRPPWRGFRFFYFLFHPYKPERSDNQNNS